MADQELERHVLYRGAREYFTWPITATDGEGQPIALDAVSVGISDSTEVEPSSYQDLPVAAGKLKVLLAGSNGAGSGAIVLPVGTTVLWTRATDNPEVIPRPLAKIRVP